MEEDETVKQSIARQVAEQGLRLASSDEAGWYVTVVIEGEASKVWATDLP